MNWWKELRRPTKHLIILLPLLLLWMFINAGIYQQIHNRCDNEYITYFQSFGYLMTIAFTIGYGHITPSCPGGKVYSFFFAYLTIPMVIYFITLCGKKVMRGILKLEGKSFNLIKRPLLKRMATILLLDLFTFLFFIVIPAGIVKALEKCFSYGESLWYTFQTVTTIGFGDVIAATSGNDYCIDEPDYDVSNQSNAIFWVSKMIFLLIALSFAAAAWLLKYDTLVEQRFAKINDRGQLSEAGQAIAFEDAEMIAPKT